MSIMTCASRFFTSIFLQTESMKRLRWPLPVTQQRSRKPLPLSSWHEGYRLGSTFNRTGCFWYTLRNKKRHWPSIALATTPIESGIPIVPPSFWPIENVRANLTPIDNYFSNKLPIGRPSPLRSLIVNCP